MTMKTGSIPLELRRKLKYVFCCSASSTGSTATTRLASATLLAYSTAGRTG